MISFLSKTSKDPIKQYEQKCMSRKLATLYFVTIWLPTQNVRFIILGMATNKWQARPNEKKRIRCYVWVDKSFDIWVGPCI